jgi:glucose-6-phosphate isomerase
MEYTHQTESCFSDAIGAHGVTKSCHAAMLARTEPALDQLRRWRDAGTLPLLALPYRLDDIDAIAPIAERFRSSFDDVIVLGTGGSSLGGKSLYALADAGWGPLDGAPRLHFMDNVDPHSFTALFAAVDWARTGLLTISKSGGTAETLTQTTICLTRMAQALGAAALRDHVVVITEDADNPLRALAERHTIPILDHDPLVGGRYAALSIVGLLPSMIAGLDPKAIRDGAAAVLDATLAADNPTDSAPAVGAALSIGLAQEHGIAATIVMPYLDRLAWFASWHRQLWAESLGKNGVGTTPVNALGTVDQHSQVQLYLDGPADKMFTVIYGPSAGTGDAVSESGIDHLEGRRMGDLLDACQRATAETLAARGRPVRIMVLAKLTERTMGALMMHFMLETIIAAHLLGVDPFDQPAVEEGKHLARRYMEELSSGRAA